MKNSFNYILYTILFVFLPSFGFSQSVMLKAPTLTLSPTDNMVEVALTLNLNQIKVSALTYSIIYNEEVIQAGTTTSIGIHNAMANNSLRFALVNPNGYNSSVDLATINFEVKGKPGTQSPLIINLDEIYDENNNPVNNSIQVVNGSISIQCSPNSISGCTNDKFTEYDPLANCDDGTCTTLLCQNPNFQKYGHFDISSSASDISADGKRIVISDNSSIQLYEARNGNWIQIANDLFEKGDIMMSNTGNRIVINEKVTSTTHSIKTYDLNGINWKKVGPDISLTKAAELSLSENGTHLLISYPYTNPGSIEVYEWKNSVWLQKGNKIIGSVNTTNYALYNDITEDGNIFIFSTGNRVSQGWEIRHFNNGSWLPLGNSIMSGTSATPQSCKIADNGKTIMVVDYASGAGATAKSYEWNGTTWLQKGNSISNTQNDGKYVELSGDASTFGLGGSNSLFLYKWNGLEWSLVNTLRQYNNEVFDLGKYYEFSYDGNALFAAGLTVDSPGYSSYYANDCHETSQSFCTDIQLLEGQIQSDTYSSGNIINANGLIDRHSGGDVKFESEHRVNLMSGFESNGAVNFEIKNTTCNPD